MRHVYWVVAIITAMFFGTARASCDVSLKSDSAIFFVNKAKNISPDDGQAEASGDFVYYMGKVKASLEKGGVVVIQSRCNIFRVKEPGGGSRRWKYSAEKIDECCGVVFFSKSKKPEIYPGVMTDSDLLDEAKKYFNRDF